MGAELKRLFLEVSKCDKDPTECVSCWEGPQCDKAKYLSISGESSEVSRLESPACLEITVVTFGLFWAK